MNTKVDESKLISGREALIALANGDEVEWTHFSVGEWHKVPQKTAKLQYFLDDDLGWKFRLKPRTILINGIEVPAPFEPKEEDQYWYLDSNDPQGYNTDIKNHEEMFSQFKKTAFCQIGLWRTEEEIKQVVAVLRQVFGGSHDN